MVAELFMTSFKLGRTIMKKIFGLVSMSIMSTSLLLTGCGGGEVVVSSIPFTSFSEITPPEAVTASGLSSEAEYTAPAPAFAVTTVADLGVSQTSSATLTYGSSGTLDKVAINTPNSTITWSTATGDSIDTSSGVVIAVQNPTGANVGIFMDAIGVGWNYQTFGSWATGLGTGSGNVGAISIGAPTTASTIPVTGIAVFTGLAAGAYFDSVGDGYFATGELTVGADFSNRSLSFTTSNTEKVNLNTALSSTASNLNMIGTLTYSPGVNSFSGTVNATGLTGTAEGLFYGPVAQELGGVFNLTGSGVETYSGAFGAKQ